MRVGVASLGSQSIAGLGLVFSLVGFADDLNDPAALCLCIMLREGREGEGEKSERRKEK